MISASIDNFMVTFNKILIYKLSKRRLSGLPLLSLSEAIITNPTVSNNQLALNVNLVSFSNQLKH
jgi:hypothetical protein